MTAACERVYESGLELRRARSGGDVIAGIAVRYGRLSRDLGGYRERIMPGAVTAKVLAGDVLALHEHDTKLMLGRTSTGTLRLGATATELRYEVDVPNTNIGRDLVTSIRRGDVKGSSFGFRAVPTAVKWTVEVGETIRNVHEIAFLRDVSTTALPAYDDTAAEVVLRSLAEQLGADPHYVRDLAEAGQLARVVAPAKGEAIYRRPAHWFV